MNALKKKFLPTFRGVKVRLGHRSVLIQCILGGMAVIAGLIMKLDSVEWLAVIICIGCVITAEMMNTAIEWLCDLYSTKKDERIRNIKDVAGAAVLISAMAALACAVVILIRHI